MATCLESPTAYSRVEAFLTAQHHSKNIQRAYIWGQTRRGSTGIPGRTSLIAPLESMKQPKIITYVTATHWFNMLVLNLIY